MKNKGSKGWNILGKNKGKEKSRTEKLTGNYSSDPFTDHKTKILWDLSFIIRKKNNIK